MPGLRLLDKDRLMVYISLAGNIASFIALAISIAMTPPNLREQVITPCAIVFLVLYALFFYQLGRPRGQSMPEGKFEWQWAGENWHGYVEFSKKNAKDVASITVRKIRKERTADGKTQIREKGPLVLASITEGAVQLTQCGLALTFPVRKYINDPHRNGGFRTETMVADLRHVDAFAGTVQYVSEDGTRTMGDMVLVKYESRFYQ